MTGTTKTISALALAALLSLALFLSPVGISTAQDDQPATDGSFDEPTDESAGEDRPGRFGDLTDEEREALRAEREAERTAFIDDVAAELGVTSDALVAAFRSVAIDRVEAKAASGELTEERAAEIIERIESGDGLPGLGRGGPGAGPPRMAR